jgi:hypothetical protein
MMMPVQTIALILQKNHPSVIKVLAKKRWQSRHRDWTQTADRQALLHYGKQYNPEWFFYADADERFEGDIRGYLERAPDSVMGVRISLLDAYITEDDKRDYDGKKPLFGFRKYFGPERRDILMIWRNVEGVRYEKVCGREPSGVDEKKVITNFYCQHYGKSLSIQHWEDTCNYYAIYLPRFSDKWKARMGKAVHDKSDFGLNLYTWDQAKKHSVLLSEIEKKKAHTND